MNVPIVVHHHGRWFDPHFIATYPETAFHVVAVNDHILGKSDIPTMEELQSNLLYWVRQTAEKLHGNTRSKVKRGLAYMERLEPYTHKGDYDTDLLFFSQLRRTNALIQRTMEKRQGYNNKIKQRFAYLDVVLAKYGRQVDRDRLYVFRVDKSVSYEQRVRIGEEQANKIFNEMQGDKGDI